MWTVDHQGIFTALRAGLGRELEGGNLSVRLVEPLLVGQSGLEKVAIVLILVKEITQFNT